MKVVVYLGMMFVGMQFGIHHVHLAQVAKADELTDAVDGPSRGEMMMLYGDEQVDQPVLTFPLPTPTRSVSDVQPIASRSFLATITAYCLQGAMRNGRWVHDGAVAVDPGVIALGSQLRIDGLAGAYTAEDTGGGVHGAHVDVWMQSCDAAERWGRQTRLVEVL